MSDLERYRDYETDHEPDGWPAIQMKDVTALVDEIEQQRARVKELEAEKAELVEALEAIRDLAARDKWMNDFESALGFQLRAEVARAALAAHRKQQEGEE